MQRDYTSLNKFLLSQIFDILPHWLPDGFVNDDVFDSKIGGSWVSVRLEDGHWWDHDDKGFGGSGLCSLYMHIHDCSPERAFDELTGEYDWPNERGQKNYPVGLLASPPAVKPRVEIEPIVLERNKEGNVIANTDNVMRVLAGDPQFAEQMWFDDFHQRIITTRGAKNGRREWADSDDIDLLVYLQRHAGFQSLKLNIVSQAVLLFASQNVRNEPRDWFETLKWDGTERIDTLFPYAFGAPDTDYTRAASRNFMTMMVARIYDPGCKVDYMPVLEGKQGKFKSSALRILGGDFFMETGTKMGGKAFLESLHGKLLVEIAELDSMKGASAERSKRTITAQVDRFRPSFGKHAKDFKRTCVFVGTTNEDDYLEDPSGGRRFWPIATGEIKLDYLKENRAQLFAEAVVRFKAGKDWWDMPEEAAVQQARRRRRDAWEDVINEWWAKLPIPKRYEWVSSASLAYAILRIEPGDFDRSKQMRFTDALKVCGWESDHVRSGNVWRKATHLEVVEVNASAPEFVRENRNAERLAGEDR